MRKLRLDPDALAVESFAPRAECAEARGTVQANENIATGVYSCWKTCYCPSHHATECCGVI